MLLLLIRHFDSVKNASRRLASDSDAEGLTTQGRARGQIVAGAVADSLALHKATPKLVYSSSSRRGVESAELISRALGDVRVQPCEALRSTRAGIYAGLSIRHLSRSDPGWYERYKLYKTGLYSLYDLEAEFPRPGRERKRDFEGRVIACLQGIIAGEDCHIRVTWIMHTISGRSMARLAEAGRV